jgi:pyruvate,water dikinase
MLGRDRDNPLLDELDERDPAVMEAIKIIVRGGTERGLTVSICGQAPSNYPEVTRKLVEWGATSISVSPDSLVSARKIVLDVEAELANSK